jgi:hypothetical protein
MREVRPLGTAKWCGELVADDIRRRSGWTIRRRLTGWLVGSLAGAAIIAIPDSDDRLFSFSRTHGPSPVDVLGMLVLLAVWIPIPAIVWRRRKAFRGGGATAVAVLAVAGSVGLAVTVGLDLGRVYLVPVMVLLVAQLLALRVVAQPNRRRSSDAGRRRRHPRRSAPHT